ALAPIGRRFLSAGMDMQVLDWKIDEEGSFRRHAFKTGAAAVAYMPNGRQAVCCDENTIILIDLATNKTIYQRLYPRGSALCLAAANDGKHIIIAGSDGTLHWWDLAQPREESHIDISTSASISSVALSPDGQKLAIACSDGQIGLCDVGSVKKLWLKPAH